ncbi:cytochrome P450 [Xylariales sp. PMI_506]|nr:cytochrome P450 [Xylariales sp. PMI_506]
MSSSSLLNVNNVLVVCGTWVVYQLLKALYNISPLHPLSKVPGPKLAAATYLPEFYHDVVLGGRYTHTIRKMHETYGPFVRISPNATHCNDVNFIDEVFAVGGRKRDKPWHQINGVARNSSGFTTKDHDLHRMRRAPVAKFFSQGMILRLEDEVSTGVRKLCDKLIAESGRNKVIDVASAYSCFTTDTISTYCFGESFGLLDQEDWTPNYRAATLSVLKPGFVFRFFPQLAMFVKLGEWFINYLPTDVALLIHTMKVHIPNVVQKTKADMAAGIRYERPTIFASLFESDLAKHEKTDDRMSNEAVALMGAGTETTSWTLAVLTYHLLSQPDKLARLTAELNDAVSDPLTLPPWTVLEKLPYLGAVIQEGLRLSYGVSERTLREPMGEDLVYRGEFNKKPVELVLPRGYAIGMTAALVHHDESVFPDSNSFIPERWLDENNRRNKDPERGQLAFGRGSRGCLGKNLALCELHLALTALTLRVFPRMKLYETTVKDITYDHDMFVMVAAEGTNGVRVTFD